MTEIEIEVGMTVRILPNAEYEDRFAGEIGTIERCYSPGKTSSVGIRFENKSNPASSYGVFWFSQKNIIIISEENNFMNKNFVTAGIKFLDGTNTDKAYAYALYDTDILVGDTVVVKTGHHGFALAEVASIGEFPNNAVQFGREIVDKVDFTAYNIRQTKAQRVKELRVEMDRKVAELQHTALYEMLSERDPELKALLTEYKSIIE